MEEYIDLTLDGVDDEPIIDTPFELFLQEIELALTLYANEIWGVTDTINLKRYVFNKYVSVTQIRNEIKAFIDKHAAHAGVYQYNVSVELILGELSDMLYIAFSVMSPDNSTYETVKKFLIGQ